MPDTGLSGFHAALANANREIKASAMSGDVDKLRRMLKLDHGVMWAFEASGSSVPLPDIMSGKLPKSISKHSYGDTTCILRVVGHPGLWLASARGTASTKATIVFDDNDGATWHVWRAADTDKELLCHLM